MASPFAPPASRGVVLPTPDVFAVMTLVLVLGALVTLFSHLPYNPPLDVTLPLVEIAVVVYAVAVWRLFATRTYAWPAFLAVARPAFAAAATAAAIVELAFVYDKTGGRSLAILSTGLALIVLDLSLLLGYSVARNEPLLEPEPEPYVPFGHGS
jgi:Na+/glutamate symporter